MERAPDQVIAYVERAMCQVRAERWQEAAAGLSAALSLHPQHRDLVDALARVLATMPQKGADEVQRAVELAEGNLERARAIDSLETLETLAMARAAQGDFAAALDLLAEAEALAEASGRQEWLAALRVTGAGYAADRPTQEPWPDFVYAR